MTKYTKYLIWRMCKKIIMSDEVKKYLAYDKKVQIICVNTKDLVQKVVELNDLTPTTAATAGRVLTASGIVGHTEMKEDDDSVTIQIKGDGPIGNIICVASRESNVVKSKIYIQNPHIELPLKPNGKIDVGGAVGKYGYLNIIRKSSITDREYSGLVPLVSGEIAEDFTEYFVRSSQKPTVLALGVLVDQNGIRSSGGYMLSLLPDTDEDTIRKIEDNINKIPSISEMLSQNKTLDEIASIVSGDENVELIEDNLKIVFECDCSREKFENGMISLGKEELEKMLNEDGCAEVTCHFCNKKYFFDKDDLKNMIESI